MGYSLGGPKESDMTEHTHTHNILLYECSTTCLLLIVTDDIFFFAYGSDKKSPLEISLLK